jgi:hypothetical protein
VSTKPRLLPRAIALTLIVGLAHVTLFALTASDNFNRANEDPLSDGGNWTNLGGDNFTTESTSVAAPAGSGYNWVYRAGSWSGDHSSEFTLTTYTANVGYAVGVAVRMQGSGENGYELIAYNGNYLVREMTAGTPANIATLVATPSATDVMKLSITGSNMTASIDGTPDANCNPCSDASFTGGAPGMSGIATLSAMQVDDWSGADVGGGGGSTLRSLGLLGVGQ